MGNIGYVFMFAAVTNSLNTTNTLLTFKLNKTQCCVDSVAT